MKNLFYKSVLAKTGSSTINTVADRDADLQQLTVKIKNKLQNQKISKILIKYLPQVINSRDQTGAI